MPHKITSQTSDPLVGTGSSLHGTPRVDANLDSPTENLAAVRVLRRAHSHDTIVAVRGVAIGGQELTIIAGPCAVETPQQLFAAAELAAASGAHLLRGGAFKLRTSPYAFSGLGEAGLKLLSEARRVSGLPVVTEVVDEESVLLAAAHADMLQIGTRNMHNYVLLKQAAATGKPILLKRGMAATLEEFLQAAEYILAAGNAQVVLCERGIRTFSDFTRNTLDLNIVPALKLMTHLPVITDPSHGTGRRDLVIPMARASVAAGADGVLIEMHPDPERALSDGYQSLDPEEFGELMHDLSRIATAVGRTVTRRGQ
ncbi:MAG: 3-deoxy-7-phosphoheptulonate synthase [bacterium]|nr:3-deoxy-7-phosphoheptulonate synthase [bacterium]